MNLQVIASPAGDILWISGALPGSVHDKKAEWIWGVLDELEAAGLVTLADKGYQGSTWAKIPYRGRASPDPRRRPTTPTRNSAPRRKGKRAAQNMEGPHELRCCPWRAGNSPRPSTFCRSARHNQDEKGSVLRPPAVSDPKRLMS